MYKLTKGAIQKMVNGIYVHEPILQVLNYRKPSVDREYKLVLYDLKDLHFSVILSAQLNSLITNNVLTKNSICQINKYTLKNTESGKRLMILSLDVKVPGSKVGGKLRDLEGDLIVPKLEEQPVLQAKQPVLQAEQPVLQAKQPVLQAEQPVLQAKQPVLQAEQPVLQAKQPVLQAEQPVLQAKQPVLQAEQPVLQAKQPVLQAEQPVLQAEQPVLQAKQPVLQAKQPLFRIHYRQPSTLDTNISTIPIKDINPCSKNVVIKAKVCCKFPIRKWYNANGSGQMFCMDLQDDSGEIRCTAFGKECDQFFDMVTVGKVYYFSKFLAKVAKQVTKNKYEMVLLRYSKIVLCNVEEPSSLVFNFTSLSDLNEKQCNDIVDVLAIIKSCGDVQRVAGRNGEVTFRDIELSDNGNTTIKFKLWDSYATTFSGMSGQILAIKGATIRNYNSRMELSTYATTIFEIDPDIPEAHTLRI